MVSNNIHPVVIIGAGPAGLSTAYGLMKRNIPFLILERGPEVAYSWCNMPANLRMISVWFANTLPGTHSSINNYFILHKRISYVNYLQNYAKKWKFPVQFNCETYFVNTVENDYFSLHTSQGLIKSNMIINATGYFTQPFIPDYQGCKDTLIKQFHVAEYKDANSIRKLIGKKYGRILVVGKRISAGQLIDELSREGFDISLSSRSPVTFTTPIPGIVFFSPLYIQLENILVALKPHTTGPTFPPMKGGRTKMLIKSGQVTCYPDIQRFRKTDIMFNSGQFAEFDLVIYATGYRPALGHLSDLLTLNSETGQPEIKRFESVVSKGLFFVGLDKMRSFRSRYIRGIREDALEIANIIAERYSEINIELPEIY